MNEIPAPPPPPPPQKSVPWKIIIPIAIVVILCCLCLGVIGVLAYLGSQGQGPFSFLQGNNPGGGAIVGTWDLYYSWDCTGSYNGPASVQFYSDGTYYAYEDSQGAYGTWTLTGNSVDWIYDEYPYANYIGKVDGTGTYIEGTMSTSDGSSGCFYANKR